MSLKFAFYGRVSTEDAQDPEASRAWQKRRATDLIAPHGGTLVTDYFDIVKSPTGDDWLINKTIVEDPRYLTQPYIVSQQFKKEPDGSKWNPTPCEVIPPAVDEKPD